MSNAKTLIDSGLKKFSRPFSIATTSGDRIILPPSPQYIEWVKSNLHLSHQASVGADFFAGYPGFEGIDAVNDPRHLMIDVIKKHLSKNESSIAVAWEQLQQCLDSAWTDDKEWHSVDWGSDAITFVAHMSAAVFVGPELACNSGWQGLITSYTVNLFLAARALRSWPAVLRPVVHWVLPNCRICREQVATARSMLETEFARREAKKPKNQKDSIEWMEQVAAGRSYDAAAAQLGLAISSIHTTTQLLTQTLIDMCMYPALLEPLRKEVTAATEEHGFTTAGLYNMKLLDSVIKETQRLKPGMLVNLERMATSPVTLPNGIMVPTGTQLAVSSFPSAFLDSETYLGDRFLDDTGGQLVSSSTEHYAFGMGKYICPGRFLVANELKIALASVLTKYDVKLEDGAEPKIACVGFEMLADPKARVEVRRRA